MRTAIPFTTPSGYSYFYSFYYKQFILSHPLLNHFILLSAHPGRWSRLMSRTINTKTIRIRGLGTFPSSEFRYYLGKFRFYKKQGFFKAGIIKNRQGELLAERIKQNLAVTRQVIFETTEECNLDCVYCTYSKFYYNKDDRSRKKIRTEDAKSLLKLLIDRRDVNLSSELTLSFYGGEPLRNFAFINEIADYAKDIKPEKLKLRYSMTTNGLLLKKYMDFLVEHDFELAISLDGDEFSNSFRVIKSSNKPSFGLVSRNIDLLKEKHPDYFKRKVNFMTVRHSRNSLRSIHDFFSSRYDKTPVMAGVTTVGLVEEHKQEFHETFVKPALTPADNECYIHELFTKHPRITEISETIERFGDFVFRQPRQILKPARKARDPLKYLPTATCSPFDLRIYMSADGGIYPCEHIGRQFEVGSVKETGIELDNERVSRTYNAYFNKIRKLCSRCYLSEDCKECVFNMGVETDTPSCDFFLDRKKFASHLAGIFDYFEKDNLLFARIRDEAFAGK